MSKKVEVIEIQDKYNENKRWLVKKTSCNHYYFNQINSGYKLNKSFTKTTKRFLRDIGILDVAGGF